MLEVFLREEIFQLTNTLLQRWLPFFFFFFACDKMEMKHGFMSCFFVICMDLGQLKLMKYCDMG